MDGFEVLDAMRQKAVRRDIPVMVITAKGLTIEEATWLKQHAENACLERKHWHDRELGYLAQLKAEKERSDALLRSILPGRIAGRLNSGEVVIAGHFESATILFCDLVGFTKTRPSMRFVPAKSVGRQSVLMLHHLHMTTPVSLLLHGNALALAKLCGRGWKQAPQTLS